MAEKHSEVTTRQEAIIFLYDNAGPRVGRPVKYYLKNSRLEVTLTRLIAPSDYNLMRLILNTLTGIRTGDQNLA